jgi:shikimate dehydrogenase
MSKQVFLIGDPVAHSISPAMHNAAFEACGLTWRYALLETPCDQLARVMQRLRADDCAGANVTIPHKQAVIAYLDDVTPTARRIGAVNTIIKHNGKLIGENTDAYGVLQVLRDAHIALRGARVVVLGAGGAARAAVFALADAGVASIGIINRTASRAHALADALYQHAPHLELSVNQEDALTRAHLIINATSLGMTPRVNESPLAANVPLARDAVVFDMVYRPPETRLLREAARAGAQTLGGLGMLVHQGALAFTLWTGHPAPVRAMFDAAQRALEGENENTNHHPSRTSREHLSCVHR